MAIGELLNSQVFWLLVAVMASFLVAAYFILKQAIADGLEEFSKRERERGNKGQGRRL